MKLIQHSDDRSKQDLDDEPSRIEWELLAREESLESVREEKEKLQKIRARINVLEGQLGGKKEERPSLRTSLGTIFAWRNYSVYLTTSWVFTAFSYMGLFFNLYLVELGWQYWLIGIVLSINSAIAATSRLIGGYVGDVSNRKHLSVIAMFMMAAYNLIMGFFTGFSWIIIALLFYSTMDIFKSGSTAFIMDNIPKEHSGLGISLFTAGRFFGIVTLGVFALLDQSSNYLQDSLQPMFRIGGIFLVGAAIARAVLLEGKAPDSKREGVSFIRAFVQENKRAANLLFKAVPGMIVIVVLDALSDSLFNFGAYIYIFEEVGIQIPGLTLMSIVTILVSVPLLLGTGMLSDRRGEKTTTLIIYSLMPVCAILLFIAPIYPYLIPESMVLQIDSLFPSLGSLFSTAFLAIVLKSVNDSVWYLLLLTIIQKNLPGKDTAKILSVFWFIVWLLSSVGPSIGGFVFEYFYQGYLFIIILLINFVILGWIATRGVIRTKEIPETEDNGENNE